MIEAIEAPAPITKEQIAEARRAALVQASEAIEKILEQYEGALVAEPLIVDGRIVAHPTGE